MSVGIIATSVVATMPANIVSAISITFKQGDANCDGATTVADVAYISKYLSGAIGATAEQVTRMDAVQNKVIEMQDYNMIIDINLGLATAQTVTSDVYTNINDETRTYYKHVYGENLPLTSYEDYSISTPSSSSNYMLPRGVLTYYEQDTTNFNTVELVGSNGVAYGTGFIVGEHVIATAAHCVYKNGEWRPLSVKTYDLNGCLTDNTLDVVEAHIPTEYLSSSDDMYDYALITVSDDLSDYVHFSLGTPYNVSSTAYSNVPIYVTGSPGDIQPEGTIRLFSAEGNLMDKNSYLSNSTDILCYDIDTANGDSGAPVYTITKIDDTYIYTAIAVHHGGVASYGRNWGSMITNYHLQFYNNNPNASYTVD